MALLKSSDTVHDCIWMGSTSSLSVDLKLSIHHLRLSMTHGKGKANPKLVCGLLLLKMLKVMNTRVRR